MVKLNISIILGSVNLKFENKQTAITAEISVQNIWAHTDNEYCDGQKGRLSQKD